MSIEERLDELRERVEEIQTALFLYDQSGFPRRTLLLLLRDSTGLGLKTIESVLGGIQSLDEYLTVEQENG